MLKSDTINDKMINLIKRHYSQREMKAELGDYDTYPSDEQLAEQDYVDAPHFLINDAGHKVWLICNNPEDHKNSVYEEANIVDYEMEHKDKTLKEVARELDIDYNELQNAYHNAQNDDEAWSYLNELLINSSSIVDFKYGDDENTIVLY